MKGHTRLGSFRLGPWVLGFLLLSAPARTLTALQADPQEPIAGAQVSPISSGGLEQWLDAIRTGLEEVERAAAAGQEQAARQTALRLYLDHYEPLEGFYGPGGIHAVSPLSEQVAAAEVRFHVLLQAASDPTRVAAVAQTLRADLDRIGATARTVGVPLEPRATALEADPALATELLSRTAQTSEIAAILEELAGAEAAYRTGDAAGALAQVEHAYLEGFEPLESRLPSSRVSRIERLIHLGLRPQISRGAPREEVEATLTILRSELLAADAALDAGTPFWYGAFSAFIIIVREGLEAVLLIGAMLAYLARTEAAPQHRRQIFAGVGLGIAASFGTWILARTLIPIGGASRELIEGVTALIAVGVLLYISNWLFQKTYIHDWKDYLREQVGRAMTTGSALAMAGLAFAAVYREGFETVLFYQALLFDTGASSVLAGFLPGLALILVVGVGIIRVGMRLPLRKVFAVTNAILLYLAFVFLGKGLYNLQEAGLFAPHPLPWLPDHEALRQLLGWYPIAETVLAQLAFLVLLAATYGFYRRRQRAQRLTTPQKAAPAPVSARAGTA